MNGVEFSKKQKTKKKDEEKARTQIHRMKATKKSQVNCCYHRLLFQEYFTRANLMLIKTQKYEAISIGMKLSELKVKMNE